VTASRKALRLFTPERLPSQWIMLQNNVASALANLGKLENDTRSLKEAVTIFREVLKVCSRGHRPDEWVNIQINLGHSLKILGQRVEGTAYLEEALVTYRKALKFYQYAFATDKLPRSADAIKALEKWISQVELAIQQKQGSWWGRLLGRKRA
jgi:tetratricopeptide (TPR) repeat protein